MKICDRGFICNETGLASPKYQCPAGLICGEGMKTDDPNNLSEPFRPKKCPPGHYCLPQTYNETPDTPFGNVHKCEIGYFNPYE